MRPINVPDLYGKMRRVQGLVHDKGVRVYILLSYPNQIQLIYEEIR